MREPFEYEIAHLGQREADPPRAAPCPRQRARHREADRRLLPHGPEVRAGRQVPQRAGLQEGQEPEGRHQGVGERGRPHHPDVLAVADDRCQSPQRTASTATTTTTSRPAPSASPSTSPPSSSTPTGGRASRGRATGASSRSTRGRRTPRSGDSRRSSPSSRRRRRPSPSAAGWAGSRRSTSPP